MAVFQQLPDELVLQILSSVDLSDLVHASLVSHRMRNISQPLLYREPSLITSNQYPSSLQLLIRTLLDPRSEALATHVRCLIVDWDDGGMLEDESDQALFTAAMRRIGISFDYNSLCAQVILLLHLLPQLHSLQFLPPGEFDYFEDCMNLLHPEKPITELPIAFQSLREFGYERGSFSHGLSVMTLLGLLKLPYIRSIDTTLDRWINFWDDTNVNTAAATAVATSAVTHLRLTRGTLSISTLSQILKIPRALTHFSYHPRCVSIRYNFRGLGRALQPLRGSLTHLVLDFWTQDARPTNRLSIRTIGSLRDWPALRSVHCTLLPLLGSAFPRQSRHLADVLPAGIRELEIERDQYWTPGEVVSELLLLLEQREAMVPALKKVAVYRHIKTPEVREKLTVACEEAGVELGKTWLLYSTT